MWNLRIQTNPLIIVKEFLAYAFLLRFHSGYTPPRSVLPPLITKCESPVYSPLPTIHPSVPPPDLPAGRIAARRPVYNQPTPSRQPRGPARATWPARLSSPHPHGAPGCGWSSRARRRSSLHHFGARAAMAASSSGTAPLKAARRAAARRPRLAGAPRPSRSPRPRGN